MPEHSAPGGHGGSHHGPVSRHKKAHHGPPMDPLDKYYDMMDRIQKTLWTTEHHHRKAITDAEASVLEHDGEIDRNLLKKGDIREKMSFAITDSYVDAAKKYFKIGKDEKGDDIWYNRLVHAYAGTTQEQIKEALDTAKENFSYDLFRENFEKPHMKALTNQLVPTASAHFKDEHIEDILKHVGMHDKVDTAKVRKQEAIGLLNQYRMNHAIGKDALNQILGDYAIKDKKLRSDYTRPSAHDGHH